MGKRKGEDVLIAGAPTVVCQHPVASPSAISIDFSPNNNQNDNKKDVESSSGNWTATVVTSHSQPAWLDSASFDHKLWVVRESLNLESEQGDEDDDFLSQVQECHAKMRAFRQQQQDMMKLSNQIKEGLLIKISQEEEKCQEESDNVHAMEQALQEIAHERDSLAQDIAELEATRKDLEQRIARAIAEANEQVESIDLVEEARKNQVPRLKHQISMYATTTGIKWDFENDQLLQGHASIPSKEVVRSFSIDPEEHSRFEIANKLWGVLDTSTEE